MTDSNSSRALAEPAERPSNMPPRPQFERLSEMLESRAAIFADKPALICSGEVTSYRDLAAAAAQVAVGLAGAGVGKGDRVAYFGRNRARLFELIFGAARLGAAVVPINWRLADPEIAWVFENVDPAALFVGSEFAARLQACGLSVPLTVTMGAGSDEYAAWKESFPAVGQADLSDPETTVLQIYTSGTTGRPKGAMLSQRALLAFRSRPPSVQPEWNRWTEDDVSLLVTPQFHIGGCGYGLQTICAGATGVIVEEFSPAAVLRMVAEERLSKLFVVPTMLQMLLAEPGVRDVDYGRIRTIVYGASPISLGLLREAMDVFGCGFVQQYGMTELAGTVTALPPEEHDPAGNSRMRSAGRALAGVDIVIADPAGRYLPAGQTGEILIRTPTAMNGYWRAPEATSSAFDGEGFYRSGDAGYLDEDGFLYIIDRLNDMIVSGGENVYPAEVENALLAHPGIEEAAVIGIKDEKWGERIKAVVVARGDRPSEEELMLWCRARLAGYKTPRTIVFVDALPRNPAGKINRRALRG